MQLPRLAKVGSATALRLARKSSKNCLAKNMENTLGLFMNRLIPQIQLFPIISKDVNSLAMTNRGSPWPLFTFF